MHFIFPFFPNSVSLEGSSSGKRGPGSATGASGAPSRRRTGAEPARCWRGAGAPQHVEEQQQAGGQEHGRGDWRGDEQRQHQAAGGEEAELPLLHELGGQHGVRAGDAARVALC